MQRLLLALLFLIPACALEGEPADFAFLNQEPETIDPNRVSGQPGGRIASNLFEGLTVRHPRTLAPQPGMAERWELSADGRTYTFHLREATWSDGHPLTSDDFRFGWTRLLDPATAAKYASMLYPLRGARAFNAGEAGPEVLGLSCPDDRTFVVELDAPLPYFLDLCAYYALLPLPRHVVEAHGDAWIKPVNIVSNGAFTLADWQINRRIRLHRNERYWNAESVALGIVDALPGDYLNGHLNRYFSGVLDWIDANGIPTALVPDLAERDDFHTGPFLSTYFYRFNVTRPPLDDPRVRKALYHAVDPQVIVEFVMRGGQPPATSLVPPGLPGYEPVQLDGFQPERARQLLAEAGFPGGEGFPEMTLLFNTSEAHKQVAEVIQQQWKDVLGIRIGLQNQEWKVFQVTTNQVEYDIARGGWIGDYLDPNTFLDLWISGSGNNRTGWTSPEYDALIQEASRTLDPERRMAILRRCEEIVTREACLILPVYFYVVTNMYDATRWDGLTPNLLNTIDLKHVKPRAES